MEEELRLLGLNEIDIKVYLVLLRLGEASAAEIANTSEIPRSSIYDMLERLQQEGLVSSITKDFKKYFSAADPKIIVENLEYKKDKIKNILPKLEEIRHEKPEGKINTEVYEGSRGLQTILNMILEEKEMFVVGASRLSGKILPFFIPKWHKERIKRKITITIIYNDTKEIRDSLKKEETKKMLGIPKYWKYKFLNIHYSSPLMTIVTGNKTALINWVKENPSVVLIKSKDIAETYKRYIQKLWKLAKK